MSVTVRGTDILFNDGTTQSTAAVAPTTAQVLSATAGASANGVGTYAIAAANGATNASFGSTKAGSGLYASLAGSYNTVCGGYSPSGTNTVLSTQLAGTWRCMGNITSYSKYQTTLWLRIS